MQRILRFEMAMAMKDRPKIFQVITLALFSFAVTILLVSTLSYFGATDTVTQAYKMKKATGYPGFVAAPANHLLSIKK